MVQRMSRAGMVQPVGRSTVLESVVGAVKLGLLQMAQQNMRVLFNPPFSKAHHMAKM